MVFDGKLLTKVFCSNVTDTICGIIFHRKSIFMKPISLTVFIYSIYLNRNLKLLNLIIS